MKGERSKETVYCIHKRGERERAISEASNGHMQAIFHFHLFIVVSLKENARDDPLSEKHLHL